MYSLVIFFLLLVVLIGTIPILVLLLQFFLAGIHGIYNHYSKCKPCTPRISILVPCWNEADVIGYTLDRLMVMDYPLDALKVYVIDDGSTDDSPQIIQSKMALFPKNIFHLRRPQGGLGKAQALNLGLKTILADDWAQAVMIIDADIIFEKNTLLKMTRHFADPNVGAVTTYIKIEQANENFLIKAIASEYILSQAIARRAQNVIGALACLAGGAQLHTRENIIAIGGQINTSTLAEDTYTTFLTQINHKRAIFEGNSIVKAEEPDDLVGFWKQRFRWSRGNLQITLAFKHLWFRRKHSSNLGSILFGSIWFSTLLMPFFMITTSMSLVILLFINPVNSWLLFRIFYIISAVSYIFSSLLAFAIDMKTMKKTWFACLTFPGLISIFMMILSIAPDYFILPFIDNKSYASHFFLMLFMDAWVSICMFFAWLIYRLAKLGAPNIIINFLLLIVGYGPMLCVITFLSFIAELKKSNMKWDKTEKKLKIQSNKIAPYHRLTFKETLEKDIRAEYRLLRDELLIIIFMIGFFLLPLTAYYYQNQM